jgi:hypothetical protein
MFREIFACFLILIVVIYYYYLYYGIELAVVAFSYLNHLCFASRVSIAIILVNCS